MRLSVLLGFFCVSWSLSAHAEAEREQIITRIKPVGQVYVQAHKTSKHKDVPPAQVEQKAGQKTYERYCSLCHQSGLAGAPKFRNKEDWKPRSNSRTLDDLVASSLKGLRAMPAKGTCVQCTEADLKAAISYMLPRS